MLKIIRNGYKNLDSDQKSIVKATAFCLLLTVFISFFTKTTDSLFLIFVASSFACSRFFARSNPTLFSQKTFISKNGKTFSLQERRTYWLFLVLIMPISFFMTGPFIKILGFNVDVSYGILSMAIFQVFASRFYLFCKKIPLSAFALPFHGHPQRLIHSSGSSISRNSFLTPYANSFQGSILSPIPNSANGWGSIGPSSKWK